MDRTQILGGLQTQYLCIQKEFHLILPVLSALYSYPIPREETNAKKQSYLRSICFIHPVLTISVTTNK